MPPGMAERMGQMESLGHKVALSFVDGDREQIAQTLDEIATWDDAPGRLPFPGPRFDFAVKQVLGTVNTLFDAYDEVGGVENAAVVAGARGLIEQYAPVEFQELALEHFAEVPGGTSDMNLARGGKPSDEGTVLAVSAAAAWLATQPHVFPVRQDSRQILLKRILESAADAYGTPDRERVTSISDAEARAFLDVLFPPAGSYPFPTDPREWTVGEREVIGLMKSHLLTTPASATTPTQVRALKGQIIETLRSAIAQMEANRSGSTVPPARSGVQKKKDKPKRAKRHKQQRRKK
ncbi:hypothetical protein OG453_07235 [Streptomyces sp. NBC_01381]|nr:hypothetical protein [Streptomyces sp. NBC_01381]